MKKSNLFVGMFSLLLIFGLMLIGCDNDNNSTDDSSLLVGKWERPMEGDTFYTLEFFSNGTMEINHTAHEMEGHEDSGHHEGPYTYIDTTLNVMNLFSGTAILSNSNNTLTLSGFTGNGAGLNATYTRVVED
jgi:hypothetical protein